MSDELNLNAYLERIGFAGSIAPTLATLQTLHRLHPGAIPFENLDPLMGVPVSLDGPALERKLLSARRGGYCYEQNGLFLRVLASLGFVVRAHLARVLWGHPEGAVRPRSHMVLSVELGGATYLADVGFGGLTLTAPLKLRSDIEQETPHETFRIGGDEAAQRLEVRIGEEWRPVYSFDLVEQYAPDFEVYNFYVSRHPESRFVNHLIAGRAFEGGRHALFDGRLTRHRTGAESESRTLTSVAEVREALSDVFGIALPPADRLDPALERILAGPSA